MLDRDFAPAPFLALLAWVMAVIHRGSVGSALRAAGGLVKSCAPRSSPGSSGPTDAAGGPAWVGWPIEYEPLMNPSLNLVA